VSLNRISTNFAVNKKNVVAFTVLKYDINTNSKSRNINLLDLQTGQVRELTPSNFGVLDDNPVWLREDILLFLRGKQLFYINLRLSDFKPRQLFAFESEIENLKSHVSSKSLYFTSITKDVASANLKRKFSNGVVFDQLLLRHWDNYTSQEKKSQLYILKYEINGDDVVVGDSRNLMKGSFLETPVAPHGDQSSFDISPDGKQVCFASRVPSREEAWKTNIDIYTVNTEENSEIVSISNDNSGSDSHPFYSKDGRFIAWLRMEKPGKEADLNRIVLYDRSNGKKKILTKHFDRSCDEVIFSNDSANAYFPCQEHGQVKIFSCTIADGTVSEVVSTGGSKSLNYFTDSNNEGHLLFLRSTSVQAAEFFTVDVKSKILNQRTFCNQEKYANKQLIEPEEFWFKGFNNEDVMGWIWKPINFSVEKTYPTAFLVHGGPEGAFNNDFSFRWNPQIYSSAGYVAVAINFHGSTGYGQLFTESILKNWGGAPYDDLMKGLDHLIKNHSYIDVDRINMLGASYGGYMANWINGNSDRFASIVNHDGIFDTKTLYYTTEELWFPEAEFDGPPFKNSVYYDKWNPSNHVANWRTPTLVIHSELDYRLPVTEGLATFTALQRQGIPSRFLYFPDENHWILKQANLLKWFDEILEWIDKWSNKKNKHLE
ncbi:hypothetical protein HDU92_008904, partial [Lobulomyces angularis]